jgi:hypothetical protein
MSGRTRRGSGKEYIYYSCNANEVQHGTQLWYPTHPSTLTVRESLLLPALGTFFTGGNRPTEPHHPRTPGRSGASISCARARKPSWPGSRPNASWMSLRAAGRSPRTWASRAWKDACSGPAGAP